MSLRVMIVIPGKSVSVGNKKQYNKCYSKFLSKSEILYVTENIFFGTIETKMWHKTRNKSLEGQI